MRKNSVTDKNIYQYQLSILIKIKHRSIKMNKVEKLVTYCRKLREIYAEVEELEKQSGITICQMPDYNCKHSEVRVHIYKNLDKLANIVGATIEHDDENDEYSFLYDHVLFFQIGTNEDKGDIL